MKSYIHSSKEKDILELNIDFYSELEKGEVPKFIKIRISDHSQNFDEKWKKEVRQKSEEEAQSLKLPKTKKKQRWVLESIVVNSQTHRSYEEKFYMMLRRR